MTVSVLSVTIILLLAFVIPFTESGSRVAIALINKLSPASISYASGTLASNLALETLHYSSESFSVEVKDIHSSTDLRCLRFSKVCFDFISAGSIELVLSQSKEPDHQLSQSRDLIEFPFKLEVRQLTVFETGISWDEGSITLEETTGELNFSESSLEIANATIAKSRFHLVQAGADANNATNPMSLPIIELPLGLTIAGVRFFDTNFEMFNQVNHLNRIELRGNWLRSVINLEQLLLEHSAWGLLTADGEIELEGEWPLQLFAKVDLNEPPVWEGAHYQTVALTFTGDLSALNLKATSKTDDVSFNMSAIAEPLQPGFPFKMSAVSDWQGTIPLNDLMPMDLNVELISPVKLSVDGNLQTQTFSVNSILTGMGYARLGISLAGEHRNSKVELSNLIIRDESSSDTVSMQGIITLDNRTNWDIFIASAGFPIPAISDKFFGHLKGSFQSTGEFTGPSWKTSLRDIDIRGNVSGLPANVEGHLSLDNKMSLTESKLLAVINGAEISLDTVANELEPEIKVSISDLSRWSYCTKGSLELIASKSTTSNGLVAEGQLNDLNCQDIAFESAQVNAEIEPQASHAFNGEIQVKEASVGTYSFGNITLSAKGKPEKHTFIFHSEGDVEGTLSIEGQFLNNLWTGETKTTNLVTPIGPWSVAETVQMDYSISTGAFSLENHCWKQQTTTICIDGQVVDENIHGQLSAEGDIDFLGRLLPGNIEVDGQLAMDISLNWDTNSGLAIAGTSEVLNGQLIQVNEHVDTSTLEWDKATSKFDFTGENLNFDLEVIRGGSKLLEVNFDLPYESDETITGSLLFSDIEMEIFRPFLMSLSVLEGKLNGTIALHGTRDLPTGTGSLNLKNGKLARVGNKNEINAIDLALNLKGNEVAIAGTAEIGGGPLSVSGTMSLESIPRLELSVKGDSQDLVISAGVDAVISENLFVVVTQNDFDITGSVNIQKGFLEYRQLPEGSVVLSDDVIEVDYKGQAIRETSPFDVRLDLEVTINQFDFADANLKALVGGKLHLQQQPQRPFQLFGNLNVITGQVGAYGQKLEIQQGTLSFTGVADNPELALRAERRFSKGNIIVGVSVQGASDAPSFEIYSTPDMSTTERLSYLIRGRGNDEGAVIDGTALALSFGTDYLNEALFSGLNNRQGISQLGFSTSNNNNNTTATLGGYFGERFYLSYGIGLYEPVNELTTRFYIQSRFWIDVISSLNNSIDIYYSFDRD